MGLDATVRCRCWELGRCSPPPVPVVFDPRYDEVVAVDPESWMEFDPWRSGACDHEDMCYAQERIGNWGEVGFFVALLTDVGRRRFRTLISELAYRVNGGLTSVNAAHEALAELRALAADGGEVDVVELLDVAADDGVVHRSVRGHTAWSASSGPDEALLGPGAEFLVSRRLGRPEKTTTFSEGVGTVTRRTSEVVFRSAHFTQRRVGDRYLLLDVRTGDEMLSRVAANVADVDRCTVELRVRSRLAPIAEVTWVHLPLQRIMEASVATGNPVAWS